MPSYKVTDPTTGHTLTLTGDSPPSEAELNQIFAQAGPEKATPKAVPQGPLSLGDVASGAVQNFIPSAKKFGENIYNAVRHPVDTASALYHVGAGAAEKAGLAIAGPFSGGLVGPDEKYANAVGQDLKNRYGGVENIKRTIMTDPVGTLADASIVAGGAGAAVRSTSYAGKIADIANAGAHVANPVSIAANIAGGVAKVGGKLASETLGVTTGAGGDAVRAAFKAGQEGGDAAKAFQSNLRGDVPIENVVDQARTAVGNLKNARSRDYRMGMSGVGGDTSTLQLDPVLRAADNAGSIDAYKGIDLADDTAAVKQKITNRLDQWKQLDPAQYHTAEGFDALKKSIGSIRDNTPYGSPARAYADRVYNAVKSEIVKQSPEYTGVMKNYSEASDQIGDIQKTLSLGEKASTDTTVRKLQSIMRNNVNTDYGRRATLAQTLSENGAPNLIPSIAGQALSSPTARGLGKVLTSGELTAGMAGAVAGHPGAIALIPAIAAQSPRLVGEASYYAGKIAKLAKSGAGSKSQAAKIALILEEMRQRAMQQDQNSSGTPAFAH